MKKITHKIALVIMIILLTFTNSILAQVKKKVKTDEEPPTLIVKYDFQMGAYITGKLKPKHNQPVVLKIININKFANFVEIVNNDVKISNNLESDEEQVKAILENNKPSEEIIPKILNTEVTVSTKSGSNVTPPKDKISFNTALEEKIKKLVEQKSTQESLFNASSITIIDNQKALKTAKDNCEEESNKLKNTQEESKTEIETNLKQLKQKLDEAEKKLLASEKNREDIQKKIDGINYEMNSIQKQLDIYGNISENFTKRTQKLLENYNNIQNCLIDVNRINAAYNNYVDFVINPNLTNSQYVNDLPKICIILDKDRTSEYQSFIKTYEKTYRTFITEYSDTFNSDLFYEITKNDKTYADLVKLKFDNVKIEVETINTLVNTSELRKKLNNVELIDHVLKQENAFEVVSNPIQPLEDYIEFKVKITPNKDLGISVIKQQVPKYFTYTEYVKGGVRWDFSAGTVFDFGIKNQEYEVKAITSSTYKIVENNTSQYTPTIAGLLHTSFRSNSMFAFGFSLGASIDLTSLNLNSFFPGISLLIGKKEKTIFTVGPAFKKVKQIKSIYDTNTTYDTQIAITDITSEQFKIGWFVGISYNLTNKQKSKIKVVN
ncbi:MAG: hypothetical protein RLZZ540_3530 [Bacteroidota bacterium]|jgi:hypothetical protein